MQHWNREAIVEGSAPEAIMRIGLDLLASVEHHGAGWPKLLRISRHDSEEDEYRYEVDVELAPGIILPMEFGTLEELPDGLEDSSLDEEDVVNRTVNGVEAGLAHLDQLAEMVHDSRLCVRAIVATWREEGLPARIHDVRLAPFDHWLSNRKPALRILLETLGTRLEPTIHTLEDLHGADPETMLADARVSLAARSAQRDELMRHGATGAINRIALNAIAQHGDVASTLRRFHREWRIWLPDDTCICMRNGRVDAVHPDEDNFIWRPESLLVSTSVELRRDLATAVGRPVTELVDHRYLSSDMSVLKTEWSLDLEGKRWLQVDLAMPWRFFCSTTGRFWDSSRSDGDTTNVVPFGRRRA